jgi:hypothetical protein
MIAAMSFLLHFMAIGAVYSDWLDRSSTTRRWWRAWWNRSRRFRRRPASRSGGRGGFRLRRGQGEAHQATPAVAKGPTPGAGRSDVGGQAAALTNDLENLEMETLGALAGSGPATAGS